MCGARMRAGVRPAILPLAEPSPSTNAGPRFAASMQARVRDHAAPMGLELIVDEAEGYAFLRQRSAAAGEPELPRLVPRRPLGFQGFSPTPSPRRAARPA
jgi:hypothetical protein